MRKLVTLQKHRERISFFTEITWTFLFDCAGSRVLHMQLWRIQVNCKAVNHHGEEGSILLKNSFLSYSSNSAIYKATGVLRAGTTLRDHSSHLLHSRLMGVLGIVPGKIMEWSRCVTGRGTRGNGGCYLRVQVLREALKISSPCIKGSAKISWRVTLALYTGNREVGGFVNSAVNRTHEPIILCIVYPNTRIKYYYYWWLIRVS